MYEQDKYKRIEDFLKEYESAEEGGVIANE